MTPRHHRTVVIAAALACYGASLFLPAVTYITHVPPDHPVGHMETAPGWFFAGFGWIGVIFLQSAAMGWLANLTFFATIFCYAEGRHVRSMILSGMSILIAVFFFHLSVSEPMPVLFSGLNDVMNRPKALIGFYVWIAAFVTFFLGSWVSVSKQVSATALPTTEG
ncbi:hypothetical protein [Luteibacter sp. dw_328]|uniref:hypothetical protein n=1 Tax=Luteibacter sp. dw_328 TaxID=2719796 RepID=UPI001BD46CED|nr:hypothetical protein [Luteibacter sp. dw_328]